MTRFLRKERWTAKEKAAWLKSKQDEYPFTVRTTWDVKVPPEQVEHFIGDTIAFIGIRSEGVRYYLFHTEEQATKAAPLLKGAKES